MPVLSLHGIDVNFPYEPYPCQIDYMKCVIESISKVRQAMSILSSSSFSGPKGCVQVPRASLAKKRHLGVADWHW